MNHRHHTIHPDGTTTTEYVGTLADGKAALLADVRAECERRILAAAPLHRQLNAANGLLSAEQAAALRLHIQTCRDRSNQLEALIVSASTFQELDVVPGWEADA